MHLGCVRRKKHLEVESLSTSDYITNPDHRDIHHFHYCHHPLNAKWTMTHYYIQTPFSIRFHQNHLSTFPQSRALFVIKRLERQDEAELPDSTTPFSCLAQAEVLA